MSSALSINVRFHDGRYHGEPEWPPCSARLFQALLAGCACRGRVSDDDRSALQWLETLEPPAIAAPWARAGRRLILYVQNNDLDSVGGDPTRVGEIRGAEKKVRPRFFDGAVPLHYLWHVGAPEESGAPAAVICRLATSLYQFGRGVDMAWAWGEVLDEAEAARRLAEYPGVVYRPCATGEGVSLACPQRGSFDNLAARHAAQSNRFSASSRKGTVVFARPPRVHFREVNYNSPPTHLVFDINGPPWPLRQCAALVQLARDKAVQRVGDALPGRRADIERVLIGRGATEADKAQRVQIIPLPSIGHHHADRAIRRLVVRVPPNCPIARDDIGWAFSGLPLQTDSESGEIVQRLVTADDHGMLRHYGIGDAGNDKSMRARRWRTVTPLVIPWPLALRASRVTSETRADADGKVNGSRRLAGVGAVAQAIRQAVRCAGMAADFEIKRIQREPFEANGAQAEPFAHGTRFTKERLWHVEIEFANPQAGPVAIGDGRYLGLGLMRPLAGAEHESGLYCFGIKAGVHAAATETECVRALRRATMARVQDALGRRAAMPTFFSGHRADGSPSSDPDHSHLAFAIDALRARLLVVAPHRLQDRTATRQERMALETLDLALQGFADLRAGASGRLRLAAAPINIDDDPLFRPGRVWESLTDYHPTRHARRATPEQALIADAKVEIARRALAQPQSIEVLEIKSGPRGGLAGKLRLRFAVAVRGPVLIGRTRHMGGGLFASVA